MRSIDCNGMMECNRKDEIQWDGKNTVAGWNTISMVCGIKGVDGRQWENTLLWETLGGMGD
jgi:hypothetical protein